MIRRLVWLWVWWRLAREFRRVWKRSRSERFDILLRQLYLKPLLEQLNQRSPFDVAQR
jgi:hypothetical protein